MKYVLGILGVIVVAILAIVLITGGGGGGGGDENASKTVVVKDEVREGVSAVITQQGKLVGEDQRKAIRITVDQHERRLEILTGYSEAVESASVFPNTFEAFETFMIAIDAAGFNRSKNSLFEDERAACPLGYRYIYELKEYSQDMIRLWDTSCAGLGTFDGNESTIRTLFKNQIPGYSKLVEGVDLNGTKVPGEDNN